jgi:hypothetical protein
MTGSLGIGRARKIARAAWCSRLRPAMLRFVVSLVVMAGMVSPDVLRGRPAWGQDDWDAGKQAVNQPAARVVMGPVMAQDDFDRWVSGGRTRDQIEHTFESLLALQVESVTRACELSDAQRAKLELAGRGDMKRFSRSLEQLKEKFRQVGQDQQKFNEIAQQVFPLQMKMQTGIFGDSSLYRKIVKQTLNPEQSVLYEQQERQRRMFRYEAKIELVMSNLETTIPLRAEQRQRLVKLLLDETEPPKESSGQYDYYVVLCQARKLGEAKLKPIFDDAQWQTLKRALDQSRGIEQHLRLNGFLP